MATYYKALVGMDFPPERRAEPGDIVDDLPEVSVPWLLETGLIVPVDEDGNELVTVVVEPEAGELGSAIADGDQAAIVASGDLGERPRRPDPFSTPDPFGDRDEDGETEVAGGELGGFSSFVDLSPFSPQSAPTLGGEGAGGGAAVFTEPEPEPDNNGGEG